MRANIILWENVLWKNFYPFSLTRPVFDLRVGAFTFRERALQFFPKSNISCICRDEMKGLMIAEAVDTTGNIIDLSLPTIFLSGRTFFDKRAIGYITGAKSPTVFISEGVPVALFLPPRDERWRQYFGEIFSENTYALMLKSFDAIDISVVSVAMVWELIVNNSKLIEEDFELFYKRDVGAFNAEPRAVLYEPEHISIDEDARIDAFVTLDARKGPIIIEQNAHIHSGAVINGPAVIGKKAEIMQFARIREGTTIGPMCRIGGEVEESIFIGNSNKYHDGFVGHSCIGEWVNLGALTTNSDLKNNYGEVRVSMPDGQARTGYNKIGTFIGDHAKLGIGTLIPSGSTIGVAANFYGGGMMQKYTPSFIWGSIEDGFTHYDVEKAISTAQIVMERRDRKFLHAHNTLLHRVYELTMDDRSNFIIKNPKK